VVIPWVPLQPSEEFDQSPLLTPSDELLQRAGDRGGFAAFAAYRNGAFEQVRIDCQIRQLYDPPYIIIQDRA